MREFAKVGTGFWSSKNVRALSDAGKLLALYLATGPHSNAAGVFELPEGYVCADLKWPSARVAEEFDELSQNGFATRGADDWVVVHKHFKHNPPENPNQAKHVEKLIAQMPSDATVACMVREAVNRYRTGFPPDVADRILGSLPQAQKPLETGADANPSETHPEPFRNKEKEKEKEKEKDKETRTNPSRARATPASPDGVRPEVWDGWLKHRGKKLTAHAIELQSEALGEMARAGNDPNEVIKQSIRNGWKGLFPLKVNGHGPPRQRDHRDENMDRLTGQDRTKRHERFGGNAERVDRPAISATASDLREPGADDVGRSEPGGSSPNVGGKARSV